MGIYIKGMEMPEDCWHCKMINGADECCLLTEEQHDMYEGEMDQVRTAFCPLIPVPPHGRLIDADEFSSNLDNHISKQDQHIKLFGMVGDTEQVFKTRRMQIETIYIRQMLESMPTIMEVED